MRINILSCLVLIIVVCLFTNDYAYACKRVIVPADACFDQCFSLPNTQYVIRSDVDLHGNTVIIPKSCSILFEAGSLYNGTIVGQNTKLIGNVKVDGVKGSFNNKIFRSSWSIQKNGYSKLKELLSLSVSEVSLDEDFYINDFAGAIKTGLSRLSGVGKIFLQCDLKVGNGYPEFLFVFESALSLLSGLEFNGMQHSAKGLAFVKRTSRECVIENISICNLNQVEETLSPGTFVQCLNVHGSNHSKVFIKNVAISSISAPANHIIGDPIGSISGLFVSVKGGNACKVEICDCMFSELHNYHSGKIVFEDVSCIYVSEGIPVSPSSSIYIHDVSGTNYGKRLIKSDCSNILVERIRGTSIYDDTLSLISFNSGNNAHYANARAKDIYFEGCAQYVISSSIENNIFYNIESNITRSAHPFSCALYISSDCEADGIKLRGSQLIAFINNQAKPVVLKNLDYNDTLSSMPVYADAAFVTANSYLSIENAQIITDKIKYLFVDNYTQDLTYKVNVYASIRRMEVNCASISNDYFIKVPPHSPHSFNLEFNDCSFCFNGKTRGLFGLEPSDSIKTSFKMNDVDVVYAKVSDRTIPFGFVGLTESMSFELRDIRIRNNSGVDFTNSFSDLYIKNVESQKLQVDRRLRIRNCSVNNTEVTCSLLEHGSGERRVKLLNND